MSEDDPLLHPHLHGELDRVAAHLDAEVRAEQAEYEQQALQSHLRGRDLTAVAREWMNHGDVITVTTCGQQLRGRIRHCAKDLLILSTARGEVDVHLAAGPILGRSAVDPNARSTATGGPATFLARMREHEMAGARLRVETTAGDESTGLLLAAADDHLLLEDQVGQIAVPLDSIGLVRVEEPRRA